jgi:hypothetical protein
VRPPAVLLQPCPALSQPSDGTGAELLRWGVDTAMAYNACAARHRALAKAVTAD